jgi:hypothetical protein
MGEMVHASIDRAIIATLIAKVIDFPCDFVSVMTGNKVFFSRRRTSPKKAKVFMLLGYQSYFEREGERDKNWVRDTWQIITMRGADGQAV